MTSEPPIQPKKGRGVLLAVVAVVVAVVVLATVFAVVTMMNSNRGSSNNNGDDSDYDPIIVQPKPHLEIVTSDYDRDVLGDVTITVKVTNTGDATGSKTINAQVTSGSSTYSNTLRVTLAPAETETYEVKIDVPFGASLDAWNAWLS